MIVTLVLVVLVVAAVVVVVVVASITHINKALAQTCTQFCSVATVFLTKHELNTHPKTF